jgi:hypothetical protein
MKFKVIFLAVIAIMMTACGKQGSRGTTRMNRNTMPLTGAMGSPSCQQNVWGRVYNNNTSDAAFRQTVANFALYNLDEIGMISPFYNSTSTGIHFRMTLTFQNGQLNPQASQAAFQIVDSYVNQPSVDGTPVKPIEFVITGSQGQAANGQFSAILADQKGSIRIQGYRTSANGQQLLAGQVYFTNAGQAEQYLGEFVFSGCGLVGI